MADGNSRTCFVKRMFEIPDWYLMTEKEENKLYKYLCESRYSQEAKFIRLLDCSTTCICDERFCYFCPAYAGDIKRLCNPCKSYTD